MSQAPPRTENWHTVENTRPGRDGVPETHCVIAAGYVEVADTGHVPTLTVAPQQGDDPSRLLLDLTVDTSRSHVAAVVKALATVDLLTARRARTHFTVRWHGIEIGSGPVDDDAQVAENDRNVAAASVRHHGFEA